MTVDSTSAATEHPFNVKSRILMYPLPTSVAPNALRNLLEAQIGFIDQLIRHRVSNSGWMAEVVFQNNVARNAVYEFDKSVLDKTITVNVVSIYRGFPITSEEIRQIAAHESLEPLRAKYFIRPYEAGGQVSRYWGSGLSDEAREELKYTLDRDLMEYKEMDDRMEIDRYGN